MTFQLLGDVVKLGETVRVVKPVTVKTKKICNLCGRRYSSKDLFCSSDGNDLQFEEGLTA